VRKSASILALLVVVCLVTAALTDRFATAYNLENLLRRTALFGILGIGAAFVIMTRGIDLSIGSVVCLVGCLVPWLLVEHGWPPVLVVAFVLALSLAIGWLHGWLVTALRLQPFIVTLCGLLVYRGAARGLLADRTQGFGGGHAGLRVLAQGRLEVPGLDGFAIPAPLIVLAVVALAATVLLELSVWGRYVLAVGRSEAAVRYAGIDADRVVRAAYVLCALLAGLGGLLFVLDVGSAQPVDFGSFYELYAIAAAVLGGCSLRGGEGTVLGVVFGAAVMQVLRNAITLVDAIPDTIEFAVMGSVLLAGAIGDVLVRRWASSRS